MRLRSGALAWGIAFVLGPAAGADGGAVQMRVAEDGVVVTLLASPVPLRAGPIELEVLVQDGVGLTPRTDARVNAVLTRGAVRISPHATGRAHNRLLQASRFVVPEAGSWQLDLEVTGPDYAVRAGGALGVGSARSRLRDHAGALALPAVGCALFALNRGLRRRQRAARPRSTIAPVK